MENTMCSYFKSINRERETYVWYKASERDIKRKCLREVKRTFYKGGKGIKLTHIVIDNVCEQHTLNTRLVKWHIEL